MTSNLRLQQLYILRGQVDLLIAMEEGVLPVVEQACQHPEEKRRDTSNLEERSFLCLACGTDVKGVM